LVAPVIAEPTTQMPVSPAIKASIPIQPNRVRHVRNDRLLAFEDISTFAKAGIFEGLSQYNSKLC